MATISYKCDTCKRETEIVENKTGFTVVGKCNITEGCLGRLYKTARNPNNVRESSPTFVEGLANYIPRRALFQYSQTLPKDTWEVTHDMGVLPATFVYIDQPDGTLKPLDIEEYTVSPNGKNKITVTFNSKVTGTIQCVARSTVPMVPNTLPPPETLFQVSTNGFITLAVPKFITYTSGPNIGNSYNVCASSNSIKIDIEISKPNEDSFVCTESIPNVLDNRSPWNAWNEVLIAKRRNYCVRTVEILKMKVFGTANLKASDIPNGTRMRFLSIDYGDGITRPINTRSVMALLSKAPYQYADKIKDQLVDIGEMQGSTPDYFVYIDGEISIDNSLVEKTYPDISRVISLPTPSPTPSPSAFASPTPSPSVTASGTPQPTVTPTITPTVSTSSPIPCGVPAAITGNGVQFPLWNEYVQNLGTQAGYVLFGFATGFNPDKMEIWANDTLIFDTGYWGDPTTYQAQMDAVLAANGMPPEIINKTYGTTTTDYEYFTFYKDSSYSNVTIRIYSPLSNQSGFGFIINCPTSNPPTPTPTPTPSKAVLCSNSSSNTGAGVAFPTPVSQNVFLGAATGNVPVAFDTGNVPDRMEIVIDGVVVLDTGYWGDPARQADLNAALAAQGLPPSTITRSAGVNQYDYFNFNKTSTSSVATVRIYSPLDSGSWRYIVYCPNTTP